MQGEGPSSSAEARHAATKDLLVVFGEVPQLGVGLSEVSTLHGPQAAFKLRRLLLDQTIAHAADVRAVKWFRYPVGTPNPDLGPDWQVAPHEGNDIGELIDTHLELALSRGFEHVVMFYADVPSLVPEFIDSAFESLHDGADLVLGPTSRGGIYLVGAAARAKGIFSLFPWRTPELFSAAQEEAKEHRLLVALLPKKDAVKTPADWVAVSREGWIPPPPSIEGGRGRTEG